MYEGVLQNLRWVVVGALFVALGILAALGLFYALRAEAFRPYFRPWRQHKQRSEEEEKEDAERRQKTRSWFWGGR